MSNIVNNLNNCDYEPPGCTKPPSVNQDTGHLDCAVAVSLLGREVKCKTDAAPEPNITLNTPFPVSIRTTKTEELLLHKLPPKERRAFIVEDISHKVLTVVEPADA